MKRLFYTVISFVCLISGYSQNLTERNFLSQLPRTTDDFQNYQFDYELENLQSHLPSSPFGISSRLSSFDGTGVFPIQHICPVKEIECYQFNKRDEKDILCYAAKAKFATNGQIVEFSGKECYKQQYWSTDRIYSQIEGTELELIPCLPNPYIALIKPVRNSKGLVTKVGNDWLYDYDSYDRVVQIRHIDDKYSYKYEYLYNTKKISNIKIYIYSRIRGEVNYYYTNDKITTINGKLFNETGYEGSVEKEFVKTYSYDFKGGVASMTHLEKKPGDSEILYEYTFENRYDDKGRIVCSNVSKNWKSRSGSYGNGYKEPKEFTRLYTYDDKGNWVKLEDNQGHYIIRKITYKLSMQSASFDENHVYDEEEVEIKASMGNTLKNLAINGKFMPISEIAEYNQGWPRDLTVNVDFVVEKDGSISNIESGRKGSYIEEGRKAICNFIWTPAMIKSKPVRSNVTLSWRFYKTGGQEKFTIIKDVLFTSKEKEIYNNERDAYWVKQLLKKGSTSDVKVQKTLAKLYSTGSEKVRDIDKSIDLYAPLAINGDKESQDALCRFRDNALKSYNIRKQLANDYMPNSSNPNEEWNALRCEAACMLGNIKAINEMIERYKIGKGVRKNSDKEFLMMEWGAKFDPELMYQVATIYLDQVKGHYNEQEGIAMLTKSANMGYSKACNLLGYFYKNGIHVTKDKKKAKMYINK